MNASSWIWWVGVLIFWASARELFRHLPALLWDSAELRAVRDLPHVIALLREIQETIEAGLVPHSERWERLLALPSPWDELAGKGVQSLRAQGAPIVPTLRRIRALAEGHLTFFKEGRARTAQAVFQAGVCGGLAPLFGGALYFLLPALQEEALLWWTACGVAVLAGMGATAWILRLADDAKWAGLAQGLRPGLLGFQAMGEHLLAWIRVGDPPDIAWTRAHALMEQLHGGLARAVGASVWSPAGTEGRRGIERALVEAADRIRQGIQVSLMEGRACLERIESELEAFRRDVRLAIDHELSLLPSRALKPLFLLTVPALLGLMGAALFLSWVSTLGEWG